jgi:hypothetical protein
MLHADALLDGLQHLLVWPRLLQLETPGVQATVPMLRGVWGAALHDLDAEVYGAVFAPRGHDAAPGYLLRPAPPDPTTAPAVHWLLFGAGLDHDDILRRAWDVASGMGLGPTRRRFFIRNALPLGPAGETLPHASAWPLALAAWPFPAGTPCRLRFPTPLRLLRRGRLLEQPTLPDIALAAWRRIQALLPEARRTAWNALKSDVLAAAQQQPALPWQGSRLDLVRWSASQQTELDLRGVSGELELPAGPGPLWPLLAAAQWLHLGKSTVVGLGELRIER